MTKKLNETVGNTEVDNLIYDITHPWDVRVIKLTLPSDGKGGVIKRGQVIDFGAVGYSVHAEDGTANAIVAESTEYEQGDSEISVSVYVSGSFRKSALISDTDLKEADVESLRSVGIFVK